MGTKKKQKASKKSKKDVQSNPPVPPQSNSEPHRASVEIETQTSHAAIRRLSQGEGPKVTPIPNKPDQQEPAPKAEPVETQTSHAAIRRKKDAPKPTMGVIETQTPKLRRKPTKKSVKPVRSFEDMKKPQRIKSDDKIPVEAGVPYFEEDRPRRKSDEIDKPSRKSQEDEPAPLARKKSKKSLRMSRRKSQFPDMENDTYVTTKKAENKPSRSIFQKLVDTVSSIFLGPQYSDDDTSAREVEPIPLKDAKPEVADMFGPPAPVLNPKAKRAVGVRTLDETVTRELSLIMDYYKDTTARDNQDPRDKSGKFSYQEIMNTLKDQGIPIPSDEDFARLQNSHGKQWDPSGTVLEYYSPVLRSFIPLNMRGRYRGCLSNDQCIKGMDISKLAPKPDALEGYVDRGRQYRIQATYDAMEPVALSEDHLDYLIEVYKTQVMLLPIPIFYDVLNLGCDTLNWNIKILQSKEGIPPHNKIYSTTEDRAVTMQKKLQIYAALGLEPLFSPRKGMGEIHPQWTKTRDELVTSLINRQNELERERERVQQANANKPLMKEQSLTSVQEPQEFQNPDNLASMTELPQM